MHTDYSVKNRPVKNRLVKDCPVKDSLVKKYLPQLPNVLKSLTALIVISAGAATTSGCIIKPDLTNAQLTKWQLSNSKFIPVDDMQVHVVASSLCHESKQLAQDDSAAVVDAKQPQSIVLLHGTSASLHTWEGWAQALDNDYCVVRMDLPGFGLTGPYADQSKVYTLNNYVSAVVGVMDAIHLQHATLAGNSLGGGIAWLTTLQHPNRVDKLILVDSMGFDYTPKHTPIGFKLAQYPILDPLTQNVLTKGLVRSSVESVYADDSKVTDELVNRYYDLTRRQGNRKALTRRMRELHTMKEIEDLSTITQPTLILWGKEDNLIPIESGYKFHKAIAHSQLVVFDNLGHVPQEEDAEATVAVVKQFLQETKPAN